MTDLRSPALRELIARGFVEQASDTAAIDAALAQGSVVFYVGFDPTATSLHVGNLVCIMAMRLLQRHGHRPIVVLGGGTARVGDPSGKTETRRMLDAAAIAEHGARFRGQFARFLAFEGPTGATLIDNDEWLAPLHYVDFLREIGVHFTINRMLTVKTYRDRLDAEQPLSFLEFNYQLLQAYDFLHLYRTHSCTLQLGGGDQWGNMVAGVELIRRVTALEHDHAHCLTIPLLTTADGRKMGKTERGAVWIDGEQTSPFDYYQYFVGCDDLDVKRLLLVFTELDLVAIDRLTTIDGEALREAKAVLALEATALAHGREAAEQAAEAARQAFGGGDDWSAVPAVELDDAPIKLVDLVVDPGVAAFPSKRQARQRIEDGAVRIDGEIVRDPELELMPETFVNRELRLQAGKKLRKRVRWRSGAA
jgi:tyrosyl-tRNA synthetase